MDRVGARVIIDDGRCQGHGRCYALAPALFEPDDIGNGMTRTGILETDEEIKRAKLAAGNCPEHAISVLDTAADETATDEGAAG